MQRELGRQPFIPPTLPMEQRQTPRLPHVVWVWVWVWLARLSRETNADTNFAIGPVLSERISAVSHEIGSNVKLWGISALPTVTPPTAPPLTPPTAPPSHPLLLHPHTPYCSTLTPPTAPPSHPLLLHPHTPYCSTLTPPTAPPSHPLLLHPHTPYCSTLTPPTAPPSHPLMSPSTLGEHTVS